MTYKENRDELKHEKAKLRSLLTGHPSSAEAQEILNLTFTPFVNWNLEEVNLHLKHVYDFTQKEAETIIENYPIGIPTQREVLSHDPPLPIFTDKDKVTNYSQNLFQARGKLSEAKKILSKNRLTLNNYKNNEEYNKAISELANIETCFLEINRFIDKERENTHTYIQE